jgi:hypothetical protein
MILKTNPGEQSTLFKLLGPGKALYLGTNLMKPSPSKIAIKNPIGIEFLTGNPSP